MTQPYPFTHTADTKHAKASAATRLRSSRLVGSDRDCSQLTLDPETVEATAAFLFADYSGRSELLLQSWQYLTTGDAKPSIVIG